MKTTVTSKQTAVTQHPHLTTQHRTRRHGRTDLHRRSHLAGHLTAAKLNLLRPPQQRLPEPGGAGRLEDGSLGRTFGQTAGPGRVGCVLNDARNVL
jgi:hypothetical protein